MNQPPAPRQWTVGQLRAELVGIPDDTPLVVDICTNATGTARTRRPLIGAGHGPNIDPTEEIFASQEFPLLAGYRGIAGAAADAATADLAWPHHGHPRSEADPPAPN